MHSFSRTVETREGSYTLFFRKIESLHVNKYFVLSSQGGAPVAAFDIKQNREGEWKVIEPAPACIARAEPVLAAFIEDYNRRNPK